MPSRWGDFAMIVSPPIICPPMGWFGIVRRLCIRSVGQRASEARNLRRAGCTISRLADTQQQSAMTDFGNQQPAHERAGQSAETCARRDLAEQPLGLAGVKYVAHQAPRDRNQEQVEDRQPHVKEAPDPDVGGIDHHHESKRDQRCGREKVACRKQALDVEAGWRACRTAARRAAWRQRFRDKATGDCRRRRRCPSFRAPGAASCRR